MTGIALVGASAVPAEAATAPSGGQIGASVMPAAASSRAMWLWSRSDPNQVVAWAKARGVGEIFVYVPSGRITKTDLRRYRSMRLLASASGIQLAALGDNSAWIGNPAAAVTWQRNALATGAFNRTHLDVEPYQLASWDTDQATVVQGYLKLLETMQAADSRPLEVDVPFWYNHIPAGSGNLADAVLARVDAVTVMSYRDTATGPNSLLEVASDILTRGGAANKPVRLGAETQPLADCVYCTFYEEGTERMTTVLALAGAAAQVFPAYAGIAIHHYDSWVALAP